jgi:hypothetical protein
VKGGTLSASTASGIGKVTLSKEFMESDSVFKKDVLSDWIDELMECYESFDCFGNVITKEKTA